MIDFTAFDALTFDCYGTIIDWERGILDVLRPWADRAECPATDADLLRAFARAEPECEARTPGKPYRLLLRDVMRETARLAGGAASDADAAALGGSVGDWPPFPDSARALARLRLRYKLIIVSNVDGASFAGSQQRLGVEFDAVVTAEEVGAYKPDHAMFRAAFEAAAGLGVGRERVLHVAQSLYHDHAPAKALGMTTVWVDRPPLVPGSGATRDPGVRVRPDVVVRSLGELADLVERPMPG